MLDALELLTGVSVWQLALSATVGLLVLIIVDGFHPSARWRLRHIPGPPPLWVVGNTLEIAAQQYFLFKAWEAWGRKYGKVFKWFWGPQPVVAVRDAEVARAIMVKHFKVFPDRSMFYPPQNAKVSAVLASGITFAKGSYWTGLRGALQPMFHSSGLVSYQPLVEAAVDELCCELRPAAASGASVDMHAAMGNVALKAMGEAAFGIKFITQEVVDGQIHENAIVHAANVALENTGKTLTWMLTPPLLKPLVWSIVARLPPPRLEALNVARMQLY